MARLARDESGAALAEYAATFLVIATAAVGGFTLLGTNVGGAFNSIASWIATNITGGFGA
jgi:Flp pilus assembly pilin Flp